MKSPKLLGVMQLASHGGDPSSLSQALVSMAIRVALIVLAMAAGRGIAEGIEHCHLVEVVTQLLEALRDLRPQWLDDLDGVDGLGQKRHLMARAGTDLEHLVAGFHAGQIGRQRDDVRLRDGLPLADRRVLVGIGKLIRGDEFVSRHPPHDGHYALVEGSSADLGARFSNQRGDVLHHAPARGRGVLGFGGPCEAQEQRCDNSTQAGVSIATGSTAGCARDADSFSDKLLPAMHQQFGGHDVKKG